MTLNTWDRQPTESTQAYQAARIYFEMGADRSLEAVGRKCSKSVSLLARWSARHNWVGRAAAYDAMLIAREEALRLEADAENAARWAARREEQREREYQIAERLLAAANRMLDRMGDVEKVLHKETKDEHTGRIIYQEVHEFHPAGWEVRDIPKFADIGAKVGRLSIGMETDRQSHEHTGADGAPLFTEVIVRIPKFADEPVED